MVTEAIVPEKVDTLPKVLRRNYLRWGDRKVAMRHKEFGVWQRYTWKDEYERVKYFALGLLSMGLQRGEKVAIIGENEPPLFWAIYAIQAAGGIPVALFPDMIPPEVKYIVTHSDAVFVIAHDQEQVDKLLVLKGEVPLVRRVIWWEPKGLWHYTDPWLVGFDGVLELGREYDKAHPGAFEQRLEEGKPDDYAQFFYTSGTTGLPKGAMLTHRAGMATIQKLMECLPVDENSEALSYMPPAWFGEPLYGSMNHLMSGLRLNFPEGPETLMENIREIAPQVVGWGPRQWENIASMVQVRMNDAGLFKRLPYRLLMPLRFRVVDTELRGKRPHLLWRLLWRLTEAAFFTALRDKLGLNRLLYGIVGGYTLGPNTFRFVRALGIPICQIFGSTEAGMMACHRPDLARVGTVGCLLPGVEMRVSPEGEMLVKSLCLFSGYYKNPEATQKCLEEGWYHTGDAVHMDQERQLIFMDRVSELGELRDGTRYAPQFIEAQLRFGGYVKDAMVMGGKERDYIAAIINIDFESVGKWAEKRGVAYTTLPDLSQKPEVAKLVLSDILRVNSVLPERSRVAKFVILHKEFDPDEAELTRTRKLRRTYVENRFKDLIEAIYRDADSFTVQATVTYQDGTKGVTSTALNINRVGEMVPSAQG